MSESVYLTARQHAITAIKEVIQ